MQCQCNDKDSGSPSSSLSLQAIRQPVEPLPILWCRCGALSLFNQLFNPSTDVIADRNVEVDASRIVVSSKKLLGVASFIFAFRGLPYPSRIIYHGSQHTQHGRPPSQTTAARTCRSREARHLGRHLPCRFRRGHGEWVHGSVAVGNDRVDQQAGE